MKDALRQQDDSFNTGTVQTVISLSLLPPLVDSELSSAEEAGDGKDSILFNLPSASSYTPYLNNTSIIPTKRLFDIIDVLFSFQQSKADSEGASKKKKNVIICLPGTSNASAASVGNGVGIQQKASVAMTLAAVNGLRESMSSSNAVERFGPTSFKTVSVDFDSHDPSSVPTEDVERFISLIARTVSPNILSPGSVNGRCASLGGCVTALGLRVRTMPYVLADWWRGDHLYIGPSRKLSAKFLLLFVSYLCDRLALCEALRSEYRYQLRRVLKVCGHLQRQDDDCRFEDSLGLG